MVEEVTQLVANHPGADGRIGDELRIEAHDPARGLDLTGDVILGLAHPHRAQTDLHGELAPGARDRDQRHADSHRPRRGLARVVLAVPAMSCPQALGHEQLDRLADERAAGILEHELGLPVREHDAPRRIDDHDGIGSRFEQAPVQLGIVEVDLHGAGAYRELRRLPIGGGCAAQLRSTAGVKI